MVTICDVFLTYLLRYSYYITTILPANASLPNLNFQCPHVKISYCIQAEDNFNEMSITSNNPDNTEGARIYTLEHSFRHDHRITFVI